MREIEKLLRKISRKNRETLLMLVEALIGKDHKGLIVKKLKGSDFYRVRKGSFRVIFHYNNNGDIVIDSIRLRNEKTYKDF